MSSGIVEGSDFAGELTFGVKTATPQPPQKRSCLALTKPQPVQAGWREAPQTPQKRRHGAFTRVHLQRMISFMHRGSAAPLSY